MALEGDEGLDPGLAGALEQLNAVCPLRIVSGRRSTEEQTRLYNAWRSGQHNVPSVAKPGTSHHETGTAADIDGDFACIAANAPRFGIGFPVPGERWHAELESAGRPTTTNDPDAPAEAQGDPMAHAFALTARAFSAGPEISVEAPGVGGSSAGAPETAVGASPSGAPASTTGGDWQASLSPAERWILEKESGLNPAAQNPTSTAFGIWQGLESTRKQYLGADYATTDPVKQLDAFRRYVKDRYGSAEAAKAHWEAEGWY